MQIRDDWKFEDRISGVAFKVVAGKNLDQLRINVIRHGLPPVNRDFWFTKDGEFDGTGSELHPPREDKSE